MCEVAAITRKYDCGLIVEPGHSEDLAHKMGELDHTSSEYAQVADRYERISGEFRLGKDDLLVANDGKSSISFPDFAIAMVDEIESRRHHRQRFTVGY